MNKFQFLLRSCIIHIGASSFIMAGGVEQALQDAEVAARGNTAVATAENASAVHYNPAGLVWADSVTSQAMLYFKRGKMRHSQSVADFEHIYDGPTGSFFFNYPGLVDGRLALGLGVTLPHGRPLDYGDDFVLRTLGYYVSLKHVVVSPAVSFKINDKLSFGATLNYGHDDYQVNQGIIAAGDLFGFEGTGHGWGYSAGIMYKPTKQWSFGVNYRSSIKSSLSGEATTNTVYPVSGSVSESASTDFDFPQQLVLGAAYLPNESWLIEVNVQWSDWSSFDKFELKKASGDVIVEQNYKDTFSLGIGARKKLNERSNLNFGYHYSSSATPASTFSPLSAGFDVHTLSVGYDHRFEDWVVSSALLYSDASSRIISGSTTSPYTGMNSDGKWKASSFTLMLGATKYF